GLFECRYDETPEKNPGGQNPLLKSGKLIRIAPHTGRGHYGAHGAPTREHDDAAPAQNQGHGSHEAAPDHPESTRKRYADSSGAIDRGHEPPQPTPTLSQ